jgi:hypothetical protein
MNLAKGLSNTAYVLTQRRVERAIPFRFPERIIWHQRDGLRSVIRYASDNRAFLAFKRWTTEVCAKVISGRPGVQLCSDNTAAGEE